MNWINIRHDFEIVGLDSVKIGIEPILCGFIGTRNKLLSFIDYKNKLLQYSNTNQYIMKLILFYFTLLEDTRVISRIFFVKWWSFHLESLRSFKHKNNIIWNNLISRSKSNNIDQQLNLYIFRCHDRLNIFVWFSVIHCNLIHRSIGMNMQRWYIRKLYSSSLLTSYLSNNHNYW